MQLKHLPLGNFTFLPCGFGTLGLKGTNLELASVKPELSNFQPFHGLRSQEFAQFDGLVLPKRSKKAIIECRCSNSDADLSATSDSEDTSKETASSDGRSTLIPNSLEVESLLTAICDTSSIAEFELKLGGFKLHVRRKLAEQSTSMQPESPAPVTAHSVAETPASDNSPSSRSLAYTKPVPSSGRVQTLLDKAADEGLTILRSPRVGYFRRSRIIKGKLAPPSCKENDVVKEGQVLCYIEQLRGQTPVQSDISGEVVKILKEDGDPVGYGDALLAILPSFPGIMKLQ